MSRIRLLVRREVREQARQPVMLGVIAALFLTVSGLGAALVHLLGLLLADPDRMALMADLAGFDAATGHAATVTAYGLVNFLGFSQYLGIAAVMAGHGMLHERQCGTLPFLLLAPVRRLELLAGKVLGAMAWPTLLYAVVVGGCGLVAAAAPGAALAPGLTARALGWWLVFGLTGPLWAAVLATACTLVSAVAHDVRSAQQSVWFLVFFATLGCGLVLTASLDGGLLAPLVSGLVAVAAGAALAFSGTVVLSRDLSR